MNMGYTGKPYDTATGLYNYGYRDYAPELARFTTVDPVRDGVKWFAYVNNDPVNWVDLWGLEPVYFYGETRTLSYGKTVIAKDEYTYISNDKEKIEGHLKIDTKRNSITGTPPALAGTGVSEKVSFTEIGQTERPASLSSSIGDGTVTKLAGT